MHYRKDQWQISGCESAQAREVAAAIKDGLVQIVAERGEMSAEQDEAVAMQTGQLLRALSR